MTIVKKNPFLEKNADIRLFNRLIFVLFLFLSFQLNAQGVKIGEDGNVAHPSAILEVESTDKGLLMPRLTNAQRANINSPTPGLQIFNTDTDCVEVYFATGGWQALKCGCTTFPDATFAGNNGSINSPVNFSANGTGAGYTYVWTFPSGTPSSSTQQTPTVEWSSAGTYTVELTVIDGDGCSSTETAQVEISSCSPDGPWLFTNAGSTGREGPTQAQINTAYSGTNLDGNVISNGGIQEWTVPATGTYRIESAGAQGGGAQGGLGAILVGDFNLNAGDQVLIAVGQQGLTQPGEPASVGGGGGSFVVQQPGNAINDALVIAGGGGGAPSTLHPLRHATINQNGNPGLVDGGVNDPDGAGGVNGQGGNKSVSVCNFDRGAGGGGFLSDGESICQTAGRANGGSSFLNGLEGGTINQNGVEGSFGGGGAVWQTGFRGSGGGGGFSGGGGGQINSVSNNHAGGGGGSINNGTNQSNTAGTNTGHGYVTIEKICP